MPGFSEVTVAPGVPPKCFFLLCMALVKSLYRRCFQNSTSLMLQLWGSKINSLNSLSISRRHIPWICCTSTLGKADITFPFCPESSEKGCNRDTGITVPQCWMAALSTPAAPELLICLFQFQTSREMLIFDLYFFLQHHLHTYSREQHSRLCSAGSSIPACLQQGAGGKAMKVESSTLCLIYRSSNQGILRQTPARICPSQASEGEFKLLSYHFL